MDKSKLTRLVKSVRASMTKHSPEILTGIGITGMITTTVLAVKATPKALRLIEETRKEREVDDLTKPEKVKAAWKCYIPAAVTGVTSTMCLIGANSVHAKRNAALATVYKISETALAEYREKVIETVGEKKEKNIREKIAADQVKKKPANVNQVIITEKGNTLCYDPLSDRYFKSDIDKIKKAENAINKIILSDPFTGAASVNDFYDEIGLRNTDIGDDIGWNLEHDCKIGFNSAIAPDGTGYEDQPCVVIDYINRPKYDFR